MDGRRQERRAARFLVTLVATALGCSLVAGPASAATPPATTDDVLAAVYAALRPASLRSATGPAIVARGAEVALAYEIVNRSSVSVTVPLTTHVDRASYWFGTIQTWLSRVGADADDRSLDACLPGAARDGGWYASGGEIASTGWEIGPIQPATGLTRTWPIPPRVTACLPPGAYTARLEYRRIGDGTVIATVTAQLSLRDPAAWRATATAGGAVLQARMELTTGTVASIASGTPSPSPGTSLLGAFSWAGLPPGSNATVEVLVGGCETGASSIPVGGPIAAVAGTDGTARVTTTLALDDGSRATLGDRPLVGLRVRSAIGVACADASPLLPLAADRAPTTWGGAVLVDRLPGGIRTVASAETFDGRPAQAVDGLADRTWNAGRSAPAWIELDLGGMRTLTGVLLLPAQLPNAARTTHRIWGRVAGSVSERLLATVSRTTTDNVWMRVAFARAADVRYLRIETVASPSWVAWREISPIGYRIPLPSRLPFGTHDGSTFAIARGAGECYANGWAWDPDGWSKRVTVRILVDGREVWRGLANQPRPDVARAGFGDGLSGFWVTLTALVSRNVPHSVRTQARDLETDRWVDLNLTPRPLMCR